MGANGSDPVNLTRHPGAGGHLRVGPDGLLIGFQSDRSSDPATPSRAPVDDRKAGEQRSPTSQPAPGPRWLTGCEGWPPPSSAALPAPTAGVPERKSRFHRTR